MSDLPEMWVTLYELHKSHTLHDVLIPDQRGLRCRVCDLLARTLHDVMETVAQPTNVTISRDAIYPWTEQ